MNTFEDLRDTLLNYFNRISTIQNRLTELEAVKDAIYKSVKEIKSSVKANNIKLKSEIMEIAKHQKETFENVTNIRESLDQQLDTIRENISDSFSILSVNVKDSDMEFKNFKQEMVSDISSVNITAYDTRSRIDVFRSDLENITAEFQYLRSRDFHDLNINLQILQNRTKTTTEQVELISETVSDIKEEMRNQSLAEQTLKTGLGTHIQETRHDCLDIYNQNIRTNGIYRISPDNQAYFDVYCDMDGGGWTLILRRVNASVDFTRGWNEYVNGFGDLSGNFWLGLEYIRLLAQQRVEIMFEGITNDTHETVTMRYNNFYIDGPADNYRMHVNVTGVYNTVAQQRNYEDGFGYHNGAPFSTFDRPDNRNCVHRWGGGGWWYNNCWEVLPTGPYNKYINLRSNSQNGAIARITIKIR